MSIRTMVALHDLVVVIGSWFVCYLIRFNFSIPEEIYSAVVLNILFVLPIYAVIFHIFGLYKGIWRFASLPDLRRIGMAAGLSGVMAPAFLLLIEHSANVPRSVFVLHPILLIFFMGGSRFIYRAWKDGQLVSPNRSDATPVLILGSATTSSTLIRELANSPSWRVVGILIEGTNITGARIHGIPILGKLGDVNEVALTLNVKHAIAALDSESASFRRKAIERAVYAGLQVFVVPSLADVLAGRIGLQDLRSIELEDLLGRDPVELDGEGLNSLFVGQSVLVTGGGGSIGSEICRQLASIGKVNISIFDNSEFSAFKVGQELGLDDRHCLVGDIKNEARVAAVLSELRPKIIFHAAAYKHVPMMESANSWEGVRNNVLGTLIAGRCAAEAGASEFVLISTDKAVNPRSIMGASKRLAESVCQLLQEIYPQTRFVIVRFGNVLGSQGSVVPTFSRQIKSGGPVTITHPDITRYFMLVSEAAQLVLQAAQIAERSKEGGKIYCLDMGEPIKIVDLAKDLIRLSGHSEHEIPIKFTGLRPGEKLQEEVLASDETSLPTPHKKLRIAKTTSSLLAPDKTAKTYLQELEEWLAVSHLSDHDVRSSLGKWVLEFEAADMGDYVDHRQRTENPAVQHAARG